MPHVVDLELLRQMTATAMRAYEAVQQAQVLTAESKAVLEQAEELLRQTTLAFTSDDIIIADTQHGMSKSAREMMVVEYVGIQKTLAQLKDTLYQLANSQLGSGKPELAMVVLDSLARIDQDYRNIKGMYLEACFLNDPNSIFAFNENILSSDAEVCSAITYRVKIIQKYIPNIDISTCQSAVQYAMASDRANAAMWFSSLKSHLRQHFVGKEKFNAPCS